MTAAPPMEPVESSLDASSVESWMMHAIRDMVAVLAIMLAGFSSADPVDDAAISDVNNVAEWLTYGRNHNEQRFSPLDQVNSDNVHNLKLDWYLELPDAVGLVATPLVADGVLYFVCSRNIARAVDAVTGNLLWTYNPHQQALPEPRMRVAFLHGSRGMAMWGDKVYFATIDGRLIALDASSGKHVWTTSTIDPDQAMYITGAPKAFRGKVLIGNGGSEHGSSRGYVSAYDAESGEQVWRFYVVPGNPAHGFENAAMEMAATTWTGDWWKFGGGGHVWHAMTYDPDFNAIYIGTGNGAPWNRKIRSPQGGDNLFLSSVVALDADTGTYRWHYQTTPGESWDFNSNMDIVLADLHIAGRDVKALLHAPKNGFFYVLDRSDGALISAEPFVDVNWASHVDLQTGRPVEIRDSRYENGGPVEVTPGPPGAHNWPSMSFNPEHGLVYIPSIHETFSFSDKEIDADNWQSPSWEDPIPTTGYGVNIKQVFPADQKPAGSLQAWDPVRQKLVWQVPLPVAWSPRTLTTGGDLVFQGTVEGEFVAYHAATGKSLWRWKLGLGVSAPPITYSIDGRQYIALLVGWGSTPATSGGLDNYKLGWRYGQHPRRLFAFSLEGKQFMPETFDPEPPIPLDDPNFEIDDELASLGADVYANCRTCHGGGAVSGGASPDLRASPMVLAEAVFDAVVRKGTLVERGMPMFSNLSNLHLKSLQHYIRQQARVALGLVESTSTHEAEM